MNALKPTTLAGLVEAVRGVERLRVEGGRTKPGLLRGDGAVLSLGFLRGVVEYDPGEFTFTALSGTPVAEVAAMLGERGQHLPFDPMLLDAGSTLGGMVASGLSGPGRLRHGGVRDFILGARMVDGLGRLLRMGGKVVKNAAGFDVPKFMVGSHGRHGVLGEVTFKVFPRPAARMTLRLRAPGIREAVGILLEAARSRFDFEALDVWPGSRDVMARLAGPPEALGPMAIEVLSRWPGECMDGGEAGTRWAELRELSWVRGGMSVARVPCTPGHVAGLLDHVADMHLMSAANVALVSFEPGAVRGRLEKWMKTQGLRGMLLRGDGRMWLGASCPMGVEEAVRRALDPLGRFGGPGDPDEGHDGNE